MFLIPPTLCLPLKLLEAYFGIRFYTFPKTVHQKLVHPFHHQNNYPSLEPVFKLLLLPGGIMGRESKVVLGEKAGQIKTAR